MLAPDDPHWIHRDDELPPPTNAWVHRARYIGPKGRKPAEELHGKQGMELAVTHARLFGRRLLVPDENVTWNLTAIPAAIRLVREHDIDVVLTTSPPGVRPPDRRGDAGGDGGALGRRPPRLARRAPAPPARERRGAAQGAGRDRGREARRPARRRDRRGGRRDRGGGPRARPARRGAHDRERQRLRGLRRARAPPVRPLPDHARGQLLRQARPAAVPERARAVRARGRRPPASSATSAPPTASSRRRSTSATGSSCSSTPRGAARSSSSATPRRCSC